MVCLGDMVGYRARPRECLEQIIALCGEGAAQLGFAPVCAQGGREQSKMLVVRAPPPPPPPPPKNVLLRKRIIRFLLRLLIQDEQRRVQLDFRLEHGV